MPKNGQRKKDSAHSPQSTLSGAVSRVRLVAARIYHYAPLLLILVALFAGTAILWLEEIQRPRYAVQTGRQQPVNDGTLAASMQEEL